MKLTKIAEILNAKILTDSLDPDLDIMSACGCDLMSDVLAFVKDKGLLLTGLMNPQVVRTAEMMDIYAIVFVRGKVPEEDIVNMAKEKGVVIMTTELPLYIASGKLYMNGLTGNDRG